jgi:hypothetical protein
MIKIKYYNISISYERYENVALAMNGSGSITVDVKSMELRLFGKIS